MDLDWISYSNADNESLQFDVDCSTLRSDLGIQNWKDITVTGSINCLAQSASQNGANVTCDKNSNSNPLKIEHLYSNTYWHYLQLQIHYCNIDKPITKFLELNNNKTDTGQSNSQYS